MADFLTNLSFAQTSVDSITLSWKINQIYFEDTTYQYNDFIITVYKNNTSDTMYTSYPSQPVSDSHSYIINTNLQYGSTYTFTINLGYTTTDDGIIRQTNAYAFDPTGLVFNLDIPQNITLSIIYLNAQLAITVSWRLLNNFATFANIYFIDNNIPTLINENFPIQNQQTTQTATFNIEYTGFLEPAQKMIIAVTSKDGNYLGAYETNSIDSREETEIKRAINLSILGTPGQNNVTLEWEPYILGREMDIYYTRFGLNNWTIINNIITTSANNLYATYQVSNLSQSFGYSFYILDTVTDVSSNTYNLEGWPVGANIQNISWEAGNNQVVLTWNTPEYSDEFTQYNIIYALIGSQATTSVNFTSTPNGGTNQYALNLSNGFTYDIDIKYFFGSTASFLSNTQVTLPASTLPNIENLSSETVIVNNIVQVILTWTPPPYPNENIVYDINYVINNDATYGINDATATLDNSDPVNPKAKYTLTNIIYGSYYNLTLSYSVNNSSSNIAENNSSATVLIPAPSNFELIYSSQNNTLQLSWDDVGVNSRPLKYIAIYSSDDQNFNQFDIGINQITFSNNKMQYTYAIPSNYFYNGITYNLAIMASYTSNDIQFEPSIFRSFTYITPLLPAIMNLSGVPNLSDSTITLTWDRPLNTDENTPFQIIYNNGSSPSPSPLINYYSGLLSIAQLLTGLTINSTYTISVTYFIDNVESPPSSITVLLEQPVFSAESFLNGNMTLFWSNPYNSSIQSYKILFDGINITPSNIPPPQTGALLTATISIPTNLNIQIENSVVYTISLQTVISGIATTIATTTLTHNQATLPTLNLINGFFDQNNNLTLTWDNPFISEIASYNVYYRKGSDNFSLLTNINQSSLSGASYSYLIPSTVFTEASFITDTYYFAIKCLTNGGIYISPLSNAPISLGYTDLPPITPTSFEGFFSIGDEGALQFRWNEPARNPDQIKLYYRLLENGNFTNNRIFNFSDLIVESNYFNLLFNPNLLSLTIGNIYEFYIIALKSTVQSGNSNTTQVGLTLPPAVIPTNFEVTYNSTTNILQFKWDNRARNSQQRYRFYVYYGEEFGSYPSSISISSISTDISVPGKISYSYTIPSDSENLIIGNSYYFAITEDVYLYNQGEDHDESTYSNPPVQISLVSSPLPEIPTGLTVEFNNTNNSLDFEFDQPTIDPAQIKIYYSLDGSDFTQGVHIQFSNVTINNAKCSFSFSLSALNLNRGYLYYIRITAINESGSESEQSTSYETVIILPPPVKPTGLAVTYNSENNSLQFEWNNRERFPNQVFLFSIYYKLTTDDYYENGIFQIPSNDVNVDNNKLIYTYNLQYNNSNLIIGNTYTFVIREMVYTSLQNSQERMESDNSDPSVPVELVSSPLPETPTGLSVTFTTVLEFTWNKPSINPDYIKIYYGLNLNSVDDELITISFSDITINGDTCFYEYDIIENFINGTIYYFGITAINQNGSESEKSNIQQVLIPTIDGPSAPTGLIVTYNSENNSLELSWNDVDPRPFKFYVYYAYTGLALNNKFTNPILTGDITDFSDDKMHYTYPVPNNTLTNNIYNIAITASDNIIESLKSNIVSVTISGQQPVLIPDPPIITAVINQNSSTTLYWIPPSTNGGPNLYGYRISYIVGLNQTTPVIINITTPSITSYKIIGLDNDISGNGNIQAININGGLSNIDLGEFKLKPQVSHNFTVNISSEQDLKSRLIKLKWVTNNNNLQYALRYTISGYTKKIFHRILPNEITRSGVAYTYNFNPNAGSSIYNKAYNIKIYVCKSTSKENNIVYINGPNGPSNLTTCFLPTQIPKKLDLQTSPGNEISILNWDYEAIPNTNIREVYFANETPIFNGGSPVLYYTINCTSPSPSGISDISYNPILDISYNDPLFYIIKNVTNETNYKFRIRAVNAVGPSAWSNIKSVIPDNPYQLTVTDISFNSMIFRWNYIVTQGYKISINFSDNLIDLSNNSNSYTINNLQPGTVHAISLLPIDYGDTYSMYGQTAPFTSNMVLPPGQSSYNILINGKNVNFIPTTSLALARNGTQILLNDPNYYSIPTLVNYVNTDISGQTVLLSSSILSASKGIYNILITTSETGTPVTYKGLLQNLNGNDLILTDISSEIIADFSSLTPSPNRIGLVAFKNPSANELLNRIVGKFYFKLMDSTKNDSFVSSGFNLPFYYSSLNIRSTTERLSVLKFNTSTKRYQFLTNAILQNNVFLFNLSGNSSYIIQQQVPDPPTNISVTQTINQTTNKVYVNFTAPTFVGVSPITSYVVTYTKSGTTKTITRTASPIMIPSLTIDTSYTFTIKAVNSFGSSSASQPVSYTPTGTGTITSEPYQLTVTDINFDSMIFRWNYPSPDGYKISIDNSNNLINLPRNRNSYTINNLQEGTVHFLSLSTNDYEDSFRIYGTTLPYTTTMLLPQRESSYNILINNQIINFMPIKSLELIPNGTQILLNNSKYYNTPTLINYVNTTIFGGQTALISSSFVSASKGIYNTLITTYETGTLVTYKGLLQILNGNDLILRDDSFEIIVAFSNLPASPNRIGLVTFKNVIPDELSKRIVGKFYFKLMDSTNGGSFVSSSFNLPVYYSSKNINSTAETLSVLKFNTLTNSYEFVTNAILENNLFSFDLSSNSTYIIQQQVPDPPINVSVTQTTNNVYINFTAPTFVGASPITSYVITYTQNSTTKIITIPIHEFKYNIMVPSLIIGTSYTFRVKAVNSFGSSSNSKNVIYIPTGTGTITNNPYQLRVTDIDFDSMIFRWNYPSPDGYRISIDNSSNLINLSNNINSYTINNLKEGTLHSISLLTSAYTDPITIYGSTLPYTTKMSLPDGQSSYNILINNQIVNFIPINSLALAPNGTQILLKDTNYYTTPTLVNYVNTDISGQNALISSSIASVSKGIFNIIITTSETGTQVTQKGQLHILDSIGDLTLTNDLSEIIVEFSKLRAYPNRIGLVTFKNPSFSDLSNGIVGKFYFKLIDSTGDDSFIYSRFKLPFNYSSSNIKSTTKTLSVLKFNTINNSYQFITNTTVRNNIFSFNLSSNSTYIIQQQVPDPPTNIYVTQTGKDIYIHFTPPTFIGGSSITSYVVRYTINNIIDNTVTGITSTIKLPSLGIGRNYTLTVTAVNSFGSSSNSQTVLYKPIRSTTPNNPLITTVSVISYLLFNANGKFLLFNNNNPEYNLYITADCYFLNEQELETAAFTSKYLTDYAFMRTVNIKFRNQNININMNTLEVTGTTNSEIIIQQIMSDKLAIGKFYSQSRRNELGLLLRFDGRSRKINLIYRDIIYTIKVAVDLGCADRRNDITIDGPNLESGSGAIISPDDVIQISNL